MTTGTGTLGFGRCGRKNLKISTLDKKFLDQVTCLDTFMCNWGWYLVDAVEEHVTIETSHIVSPQMKRNNMTYVLVSYVRSVACFKRARHVSLVYVLPSFPCAYPRIPGTITESPSIYHYSADVKGNKMVIFHRLRVSTLLVPYPYPRLYHRYAQEGIFIL